jgi:hypothetical protein
MEETRPTEGCNASKEEEEEKKKKLLYIDAMNTIKR